MTSPSSDYRSRVLTECAIYENNTAIHELPPVHHYWANLHLRPKLEALGFSTPDQFFLKNLAAHLARAAAPQRFLSLGSGNCDLEVKLARELDASQHFTIECLDLNPSMLARGRGAAEAAGLASHFKFVAADLNSWQPSEHYDGVIANQSLHHVVNLESLFTGIRESLSPGAPFLISDMIGRNGHLRWPEARTIVDEFWRKLPPSYRFNRAFQRFEEHFQDNDCSVESFEGIRSQDILPLLNETFRFQFFFGFANVIDPFVDRQFGYNFDPKLDWVRRFIDEVHQRDEAEQLAGNITPTHMLAVVTKDAPEIPVFYYPSSPRAAERDRSQVASSPGVPESTYEGAEWILATPEAIPAELAFLTRMISGAQQTMAAGNATISEKRREIEELSRWGASLDRDIAERTAWALKLDTRVHQLTDELAERTNWALVLDRRTTELEMDLAAQCARMLNVEKDLADRTDWARTLEQQCAARTEWAQRLENELADERRRAAEMVPLRPNLRRIFMLARTLWRRLRGIRSSATPD